MSQDLLHNNLGIKGNLKAEQLLYGQWMLHKNYMYIKKDLFSWCIIINTEF